MNGTDAIIEKIRSDAQAVINGINEEAVKKSKEISDAARNDARIYAEKQRAESDAERKEILRRRMTVADLEVKKLLLGAKQDVMTAAFEAAARAIRADEQAYEKMLVGMMKCADDGDVVTFSEKDKDLVTDAWFLAASKKAGKNLTKNPVFGDFSGGILIAGSGSDKNFTLEVELAGVRENDEPQIAKLLFGE